MKAYFLRGQVNLLAHPGWNVGQGWGAPFIKLLCYMYKKVKKNVKCKYYGIYFHYDTVCVENKALSCELIT